jgi:hypothetical protein
MEPSKSPDWDAPETRDAWLISQADAVARYLEVEAIHGATLESSPAWFVAPYVALWRFSADRSAEGWVISGDLPTDFIIDPEVKTPQQAAGAFGCRWREVAGYMAGGVQHPTIQIGSPEDWPALGELLRGRAEALLEWADDESVWQERGPDV